MSIYAYVGKPRQGKSYDVVVNVILPALRQDRTVVTNIPLNEGEIRKVVTTGRIVEFPINEILTTPEKLWDYAKPGCQLVLDEVWKLFPAGMKVDRVPQPFKQLLAEHGHMVDEHGNAMQIALVTQDLKQIASFARILVEQTIYHTKLSAVGASKKYRLDIYQGAVEGDNPPAQKRLREIFGSFDPAMYPLYKSHTLSEAADGVAVNQSAVDGRGNIWKRPMIWAGILFIVLAIAIGIPLAKRAFTGTPKQQATSAQEPITDNQGGMTTPVYHTSQPETGTHYAPSCMQHVIDGTLDCICRNRVGDIISEGYQCHSYMQGHVGGYGGPDAKQSNIDYLNATRPLNSTQSTTHGPAQPVPSATG